MKLVGDHILKKNVFRVQTHANDITVMIQKQGSFKEDR